MLSYDIVHLDVSGICFYSIPLSVLLKARKMLLLMGDRGQQSCPLWSCPEKGPCVASVAAWDARCEAASKVYAMGGSKQTRTLAFLHSRKKPVGTVSWGHCFEGWCVSWQTSPASPVTSNTGVAPCLCAGAWVRIILAPYRTVKPLPRFLTDGLGGILCQVCSCMD